MSPLFKRKLSSGRGRVRKIDHFFERTAECFLLAYAFFMVASFVSERDVFRIHDVRIEGATAISDERMKEIITRNLKKNILRHVHTDNPLLYEGATIEKEIRALDPRVKSVLARTSDGALTVSVAEYSPKYIWCPHFGIGSTSPSCYFTDENGYIYATAPEYEGSAFMVWNTRLALAGETPLEQYVLLKSEFGVLTRLTSLLHDIGYTVSVVTKDNETDFTLRGNAPWELRYAIGKDPGIAVETLKTVLGQLSRGSGTTTPSMIDLRFGEKVFYR